MVEKSVDNTTDPFLASKAIRQAHVERTNIIWNAAYGDSAGDQECGVTLDGKRAVLRPLRAREVNVLRTCHCHAVLDDTDKDNEDWSLVRIMYYVEEEHSSGDLLKCLQSQVMDCQFVGRVVIGVATPSISGSRFRGGMRRNFLIRTGVILEPGCHVMDNHVLGPNLHVHSHATVHHCGTVEGSRKTWTDGTSLAVGPEGGGERLVNVTPESTMITVCAALGMSKKQQQQPRQPPLELPHSIVCPHSTVSHTPKVSGVYVGSQSTVESAARVERVIMLPESHIGSSSVVAGTMMQWNSAIVQSCTVVDSLLMETVEVGPNCFVESSILGPDVHVGCGEVHFCLLGPNTTAHHQSLLMSMLWPLGRGNVGYGANIGSNHTGRIADQEASVGEGTFWGLSSVVKLPFDLTSAPYSILAAGATVPSNQSLRFPMSVVLATGEVIPGWLLAQSPYTLARNEQKFAQRRKAKRHAFYTGWSILRPCTIAMCLEARARMRNAAAKKKQEIYQGDEELPGLGLLFCTQRGLKMGQQAYTDAIRLYALQRLHKHLSEQSNGAYEAAFAALRKKERPQLSVETCIPMEAQWPTLPWDEDLEAEFPFCLAILQLEFPLEMDPSSVATPSYALGRLLTVLVKLEIAHASRVLHCKKRDDVRGARVVPGYAAAHVAATDDKVVQSVLARAQEVETQVSEIMRTLGVEHMLAKDMQSKL